MKLKFPAAIAVAALIAGALIAPAGIANAKKKKAPKGPVVIGTDDAGDWGAATDPTIAPVGAALGMDLTEASIEASDDTVNFIIGLAALPPSGGSPEIARYTWDLSVDGELVNLDGKFTNFSRGACDPLSGSCPPPRNPGLHPFQVKANCVVQSAGANVTTCEEVGIVEAVFDAGAATITIPVPMEMIGVKKGSKIAPGTGSLFGGTVEAFPAAFLSANNFPSDILTALDTYVVPKK